MSLTIRNYAEKSWFVVLFGICHIVLGCSLPFISSERSGGATKFQVSPNFQPKVSIKKGPVTFRYAPAQGRTETLRTFSKTITRTFGKGQLLNEREELVDFTVRSEVKSVDPKTDNRVVVVETIRKDGPVDLYDMGYPELGESIEYTYTTKAEVKKAGNFPANSLFFVPPVALPKRPIEVGETWTFQAQWISLRNGLPMGVDLTNIFKRVFECGPQAQCAEIEVSGEVLVPEAALKGAVAKSSITGRMLFSLETGSLIWSDIRNRERMMVEGDAVEVFSCTESILETPAEDRWPWRPRVDCDPMKDPSDWVPGYIEKS